MKYEDWLAHFNPNHDSETGRFTTSSGTYLKAGTRLNSVTGKYFDADKYKDSGKWVYTYRDDDSWDNKVYKGPFAKYLVMYRGARFIAEHKYETIKDLKMATEKDRIDEFKKLNKKNLIDDLKSVQEQLVRYNVGNEREQKEFRSFDPDNIKTDDDWRIAYSIFSHAMEASYYYKSTKEYCERIQSKYDAMVDDNNRGVYNKANDPIIIFRANEALKKIAEQPETSFLKVQDVLDNYNEVKQELEKEGMKVKL